MSCFLMYLQVLSNLFDGPKIIEVGNELKYALDLVVFKGLGSIFPYPGSFGVQIIEISKAIMMHGINIYCVKYTQITNESQYIL